MKYHIKKHRQLIIELIDKYTLLFLVRVSMIIKLY